jgi:hypothetical protein
VTVRHLALLLLRHWLRRRGGDRIWVALDDVGDTVDRALSRVDLTVVHLDDLDRSPRDRHVVLYATPQPSRWPPPPLTIR